MGDISIKPSLLFITNEFCYPTKTGSHVRISNIIKLYSKLYAVHLIVPPFTSSNKSKLNEFYNKYITSVHVAESNSKVIKSNIWQYVVGPRTVLDNNMMPYCNAINKIYALNGRFDVIHVGRWFLANVVKDDLKSRLLANNYILDFDASDYCFRKQLSKNFKGSWIGKIKVSIEPLRVRLWEQRYLPKFDVAFVSSSIEMQDLLKRTGCKNLLLVRNGVDVFDANQLATDNNQNIILFLGTLDYMPNLQGFEYFINNVFPKIRKVLPNTMFWHVGNHSKEMMDRYGCIEGVCLKGFVENLSEVYMDASIVVAPIFQGNGTRIKLLEAASYSKAIVATEFAAEDLGFTDGLDILYAKNSVNMATKCIELLTDCERRLSLGQCARKFVAENYSWNKIGMNIINGLSFLARV